VIKTFSIVEQPRAPPRAKKNEAEGRAAEREGRRNPELEYRIRKNTWALHLLDHQGRELITGVRVCCLESEDEKNIAIRSSHWKNLLLVSRDRA